MNAELLVALGALGWGFASALFPGIDGEAFIVASVTAKPTLWWALVAGVGTGQTVGKVLIFEFARRGLHERWLEKRRARRPRREPATSGWRVTMARWSATLLGYLDRPVIGGLVVLVSSVAGIPPLAAVTILAGIRSIPRPVFVVAVLLGRLARFSLIAWPIVALR